MSKKDNKKDNKVFSGGVKETLAQSTDTLWQNEVIANKFVARILIYTAVIALVVLLVAAYITCFHPYGRFISFCKLLRYHPRDNENGSQYGGDAAGKHFELPRIH